MTLVVVLIIIGLALSGFMLFAVVGSGRCEEGRPHCWHPADPMILIKCCVCGVLDEGALGPIQQWCRGGITHDKGEEG